MVHRLFRRSLFVLLGFAVVVIALWFFVVPPVLAAHIRARLMELGFSDARFTINALRPDRIELLDISLGRDEWLTARRLEATFSVTSLLAGEVLDIVVEAALWNLRDSPLERRMPPFDEVTNMSRGSPGGTIPLDASDAFPFRRILLDGARILLPTSSPVASVDVDGTFEGTPGGRGPLRVHLRAPQRTLSVEGTWGFDSGPTLRSLAIDVVTHDTTLYLPELILAGSIRVRGAVPIGDPSAAALILNVDATELRYGTFITAEGLIAAISWRGLTNPVSADGQQLQWSALRIGDVGTRSGSATFALREGPVVDVDQVHWTVDSRGRMTLHPFRFEPARSELKTTLQVTEAPLGDWLTMFSGGRLSGSGRLTGSVTTHVVWKPGLHIGFGSGHLSATGEGGVIRFLDDPETRALVETYVAKPAASGAGDYRAQVEQKIIGSLQDFAFHTLQFDLVPRGEDLDLKIQIAGKGRTDPQELDLNLNLNGFDALIDVTLDTYLMLDRLRRGAIDATGSEPTRR